MKENDFILRIKHSDIMGQEAVNTIYYGRPEEHVICPYCKETANLDPEVLSSFPPQRRIRCPHCGYIGTDLCSNLQIFYDNSENCTKCVICGDPIAFDARAHEPSAHICDNCRKAILKLRKILEEDND